MSAPESATVRLTAFSSGGGCSCKVAPGELEALLSAVYRDPSGAVYRDPSGAADREAAEPGLSSLSSEPRRLAVEGATLLRGMEGGDDAAVVRLAGGQAVISTTDFFPPVVDDAFDWGRIAAANALSDVYAMGGEALCALSLLAWPVDRLAYELAGEVLRGGEAVCALAGCPIAGGHSIRDDTPKYGLAVTGIADPDRLLRNDAARPGLPLSLSKPLGLGVLNNRHKATGERFEEAVETMAALNREVSRAALAAGVQGATDVTGFGLLGHLYKLLRESGCSAVIEAAAVPYLDGARQSLAAGFVPGGTRRNLDWVRPALDAHVDEDELLLLADAQTSGGLLFAGELPGIPVIGELMPGTPATITVR